MKYIVILGDGMADHPIASLGGKTALQAANIPNIDLLAQRGCSGMLDTIPVGFAPGSEIANLSVLGYDVARVFEGRGSLEAASMGIAIEDGEMAMRCNLITIENGRIKNHSAGHISNGEAAELIAFLQKELGGESGINFFSGVSYRHLVKIKDGNKALKCTPPHDVPGTPFADVMIEALSDDARKTADLLNNIILRSQELLATHPVNLKRISEGKEPANSVWMWSPGYRPNMETLIAKYGLTSGAVISAVDLIKGIGIYAGLESIDVEGATGLYDTNYEGKTEAAIEALKRHDFVFLHIEASDEAGHEGDVALKVRTIEYLDKRVVKPIMDEVASWNESVTIALLPDHPTPCELKTHTSEAIPFIIYNPAAVPDSVSQYDEQSAASGSYGMLAGDEFMDKLINQQ